MGVSFLHSGKIMSGRACLLIVLAFCLAVNGSNLYVMAGVWWTFGASQQPVELLEVDVTTNGTSLVKKWSFSQDTYLVGTTFDQGRGLYWMLHNMHSSGERLESYLTSVNVNTGEFYYLEYPLGVLSVWDIDLDSLGNIQFLARSSLPRDGRSLVDYMAFDPHFNKTIMLRSSAIVLPSFGSVAYAESQETMIIADSYSQITTYSRNTTSASFPPGESVFTQGNIEWNNITNTGYVLQQRIDLTDNIVVSKFAPLTSEYQNQCTVNIRSSSWAVEYSIGDASSIDPTTNF